MTLISQSAFGHGEISPALYGRVDTAIYQAALAIARNVIVRAEGSISNRPGLTFIGPVKNHANSPKLIEFQFNTTDQYILEFGDFYMRVIRNDAHVTETPEAITGITKAHPPVVTLGSHGYNNGDEVFLNGIVGMTRLNGRRFLVKNKTTNTFTLAHQVTGSDVDATTASYLPYVGSGTAARVYTVVSPYAIADVNIVKFVQSADVMTLTHPNYPPQELSRTGHTAWTFSVPAFAPSTPSPTGVAVSNAGTGAVSRNYAVTFSAVTTFEESLPQAVTTTTSATPALDTITFTAFDPAVIAKASVYLQQNGVYGLLGDCQTATFVNNNMAPDLTITPPSSRNPFIGAGNYPGAVSFYEERRVFGGTLNAPDTEWYSQTASASNMSVSDPIQDNDAITATLNSRQVNQIRHLVPGTDLITFSSGSEWQTNAGTASDFAATTLTQHPQSAWGCSHQVPIIIGKEILFVLENQSAVRSLAFDWQVNGYTGKDVTILAQHLFSTYNIVDWTFARSPDPVAYSVRSDGQACCLTYNTEQQMIAWTRWDTQGKFEHTSSLRRNSPEIDEAVFFVVKRFINGNVVRYIERTHSRRFTDVRDCFFVDAGLSYDNPVLITAISLANPCVITAPAHGFTSGQAVDLYDIEWQATYDDDGNAIQPGDVDEDFNVLIPGQLNGFRYAVTVIDANTFSVPVNSTAFLPYVENGTARFAATTITELDQLEGAAVSVLADGSVISGLTVLNGAITLPRAASRVHVGLPYVSDIQTLNIEAPGNGTMQGERKHISTVTVRYQDSRGLLIGPNQFRMIEVKQRQYETLGSPTDLQTGQETVEILPEWNTNGQVFLRQKYPLPMTILAVIPDLLVGT